MTKTTLLGTAGAVLGAMLALASGTPAQAAAPVSYSRVCEKSLAGDSLVQKAVTRAGVAHRSSRRTARQVTRRH